MKREERVQVIMDSLHDGLERLRESGKVPVPSNEAIVDALTGCLNSQRGGWRKTAPGGDTPSDVLWRLVKFHRSGGNLHGWPWFADKVLVDQMDTVAQVLILLSGQELTAVNAWQRAMYG